MSIIYESAQFGDIQVQRKTKDILECIVVLQECDAPNRNGRIYPKKVLEAALSSPNIKERLATKTWYGEANHPINDPSLQRQMTIDQRNIAFIITEIWWEGNLLKGRIETANTAVGRDMKGLIEQGCKVAFSLRAQGKVHKNPMTGYVEVEEGLQILGYDWVQVPSHAKAYMEKICEETIKAMYKTNKAGLNMEILTEAENLFLSGEIYDPSNKVDVTELDYTKNYTLKFKNVADMYIPQDGDEVYSLTEAVTVLENKETNTMKKVLTEDYIVKDIRKKILSI